MAATSLSARTPYFAETDASGNYKIENVPDGKYNVVAWHEGMNTSRGKSVDVAGTRKADFTHLEIKRYHQGGRAPPFFHLQQAMCTSVL